MSRTGREPFTGGHASGAGRRPEPSSAPLTNAQLSGLAPRRAAPAAPAAAAHVARHAHGARSRPLLLLPLLPLPSLPPLLPLLQWLLLQQL